MAKKKNEIAEQQPVALNNDPGLQNNWIDNMTISAREDGVCMLRFYTNLPEGTFEKARVFVSRDHLKNIAAALNQILDPQSVIASQ
jgi:hypothetical protein